MGVVVPTFNNFIYWYRKYKAKECTKDYARQQVCFAKTTWYRLCRDYERCEDISKYFKEES